MSAYLVRSTLDLTSGSVSCAVSVEVQDSAYEINMQFSSDAVIAQAAKRNSAEWTVADLCALCATTFGLPVEPWPRKAPG